MHPHTSLFRQGLKTALIFAFCIPAFTSAAQNSCTLADGYSLGNQFVNPAMVITLKPFDGSLHRDVYICFLDTSAVYTVPLSRLSANPVMVAADMHIRGESTASAPKHQYEIKLKSEPSSVFMNMPYSGKEWVFNDAGAYDHTFMRNVLPFHLQRQLGEWAPRTLYIELFLADTIFTGSDTTTFINGVFQGMISNPCGYYQGLYVCMEKINSEKHRLNIPHITKTKKGVGGAVFQQNPGSAKYFYLDSLSDIPQSKRVLIYEPNADYFLRPKKMKDTTERMAALHRLTNWYHNSNSTGWVDACVQLYTSHLVTDTCYDFTFPQGQVFSTSTPISGSVPSALLSMRSGTDYQSFAVYFLLNELARDPDGYVKSTFLFKRPDSAGVTGKMYAGPLWDKNKSFGNPDLDGAGAYCCFEHNTALSYFRDTSGWLYCMNREGHASIWWEALLMDTLFCREVWTTWSTNRGSGGWLSDSTMMYFADSVQQYLDSTGIVVRNNHYWRLTSNYPFAHEVTVFEDYLKRRLAWMSHNLKALLQRKSGFTP